MKRRLVFQITILLLLTFCGPLISQARMTFGDSLDHPYRSGIEFVADNQIVQGYSDGTFRPDHHITRAEFIKILISTTVDPTAINGESCFIDVNREWYAPYVCTAAARRIVSGYPDDSFRPDQPINLVEAAKIITLAYGNLINTSEDIHPWYKPYLLWLEDRQAIPLTLLASSQRLTRGEMAEMIYRLNSSTSGLPYRRFSELDTPLRSTTAQDSSMQELLRLTNLQRIAVASSPVEIDSNLQKIAQQHAENMARQKITAHELDGLDPFDRIRATDYHFSAAAENVASGQKDAQRAVYGWMNSPSHRLNLLNARYTKIGFGVASDADGRLYWVQLFSTPRFHQASTD